METKVLTTRQAARELQLSPRTLENLRQRGGGPRFIQISRRCVRYTETDIFEWLAKNGRNSTSDTGAGR